MYVIITGASSGLGKELAYILAEQKYNLILVARRLELLKSISKDLKSFDVDVKIISTDLSIKENIYNVFSEIESLDVSMFINNAGFGNLGYFKETSIESELKMIDLNIKAVHIFTKLFINKFEEGTIVNISSLAAYLPTPIHATYSATKSYVSSFSRAVDFELRKQGKKARVLTVAPGPIKTEFNKVANASKNRGMDSKKCAKIIYKGIIKKKALIIPGLSMKLIYIFSRIIPTKILMRISHQIQSSK